MTVTTAALMLGGSSIPAAATESAAHQAATTFLIETSPPIAGVRVAIDGRTMTTDASGTARFELDDRTQIRERVRVIDDIVLVGDTTRYRFNSFQSIRDPADIKPPGLVATFNVDHLIGFSYSYATASAKRRVDSHLIDRMTIKASTGQVVTVGDPTEAVWFQGSRVLANNTPRPIYWTIQDVVVDGASVVNRAEQRFFPDEQDSVEIELLMFPVEIAVHSKLLGTPTGDAIQLTHPNGRTETLRLDAGRVIVDAVPRGEYTVAVRGGGLSISRPILVSRPLVAELEIYSWLDLMLILLGAAVFVGGPIVVGRRLRRRWTAVEARLPSGAES